mgnify:CR=1 FL=1
MDTKLSTQQLKEYLTGQANYYRSYWKENFETPQKVDEFGFDEFMLGKAEAYEDCLRMFNKQYEVDLNLER